MRQTGLIASLYLLLYSAGRFVIEFYRGDIIRGNVGMLPLLIKSSARPSTAE
ncbi:prolipoprotein diacylglyceryl transferase family protein [Paenibacillus sp. FSL W8-0186]|uniref:prolipoprotein diacylglyceryl transferase family protein n=1 Tax=Paenibacillus sp. FSL W8-0186 TaxID=2921709 RepID=UPI0030CC0610